MNNLTNLCIREYRRPDAAPSAILWFRVVTHARACTQAAIAVTCHTTRRPIRPR